MKETLSGYDKDNERQGMRWKKRRRDMTRVMKVKGDEGNVVGI